MILKRIVRKEVKGDKKRIKELKEENKSDIENNYKNDKNDNDDDENLVLNLTSIKAPSSEIVAIFKRIRSISGEIEEKMMEQRAEYELEQAQKDIDRTINIKMYQKEIKSRQKKVWFESRKDKRKRLRKLKKEFNERRLDVNDSL